jgi:hypothetical protein
VAGGLFALNRTSSSIDTAQDVPATASSPEANIVTGSIWTTADDESTEGAVTPGGALTGFATTQSPLIATGRTETIDGQVWAETAAFRIDPIAWFPLDQIERLGDGLPVGEATTFTFRADPLPVNSLFAEPTDPEGALLERGDQLVSTGVRASSDLFDGVLVLIDADTPFWLPEWTLTTDSPTDLALASFERNSQWLIVPGTPGFDVTDGTGAPTVTFDGDTVVITTGTARAENDTIWVELLAPATAAGTAFVDADSLTQVASELPAEQAMILEVSTSDTVNQREWPGTTGPIVGEATNGERFYAHGERASADDQRWVYNVSPDGDERWWITEELVVMPGIVATEARRCYVDETNGSTLVASSTDGWETFTGAFRHLDAVEAISGTRNTQLQYVVASTPLGSAEDGEPIVNQEFWDAPINGFRAVDRALLLSTPCDAVAETVDSLEAFVGDNHPPFPFPE